MAIQQRKGAFNDLDTTKLVPGELVITSNPDKVIGKTSAGDIVELATKDDLDNVIANMGAVRVENETLIFSSTTT